MYITLSFKLTFTALEEGFHILFILSENTKEFFEFRKFTPRDRVTGFRAAENSLVLGGISQVETSGKLW